MASCQRSEQINRKRILVADDQEIVRMVIRLVLGADYEIVEVGDGEEAWQKLIETDFQFDLVMVDLKMPRLGGEELLTRIREEKRDVPVLLLTGNIAPPTPSQPNVRVATKPFDNSELALTVRQLIAHAPA